MLTMGADGLLLCEVDEDGRTTYKHVPAESVPSERIKSVDGAGDCLTAGVIAGLLSHQ